MLQFRVVVVFVIVFFKRYFIQVAILMIHGWLLTTFEMCGSNASLVVTAKPKAKEHFRIGGVLLFYILQNIS